MLSWPRKYTVLEHFRIIKFLPFWNRASEVWAYRRSAERQISNSGIVQHWNISEFQIVESRPRQSGIMDSPEVWNQGIGVMEFWRITYFILTEVQPSGQTCWNSGSLEYPQIQTSRITDLDLWNRTESRSVLMRWKQETRERREPRNHVARVPVNQGIKEAGN